jgi:hypothetical protein
VGKSGTFAAALTFSSAEPILSFGFFEKTVLFYLQITSWNYKNKYSYLFCYFITLGGPRKGNNSVGNYLLSKESPTVYNKDKAKAMLVLAWFGVILEVWFIGEKSCQVLKT